MTGEAKVGLALSGGGFRAAFFHVGVLARLAETGILPKVEVISTVSGGSIAGALYYLLLRRELEAKPDGEIGRDGYIELVRTLESTLLEGVQKNIRARVFANFFKNLKMILPSYSRSDRIGDLYDRYLYKPAWETARDSQIELRELVILPEGRREFTPSEENASRQEKVPILLLNATSLNSGHNWRFEAVRMGEPQPENPALATTARSIDKNMWLRQGYFYPEEGQEQAPVPEKQADFPLGLAVAASAAVPGIFHPLSITGMYKEVRVQLVDGGVQDNQGIHGLLDRGCDHLIVSDASGQMDDRGKPGPSIPSVVMRSSSVAQDRIRDAQLIDASVNRKVALMHLRRGLAATAAEPDGPPRETELPPEGSSSAFDVDPEVQRALSNVRTDLDFFSKVEAHSLGLDGYRMSTLELAQPDFNPLADPGPPAPDPGWAFNAVAPQIDDPDAGYRRKLAAGSRSFLRLPRLRPLRALLATGAVLALLAAIACLVHGWVGNAVAAVLGWPLWANVPLALVLLATLPAALLFVWAQLSLLAGRLYER